jgi:hypothetical protein
MVEFGEAITVNRKYVRKYGRGIYHRASAIWMEEEIPEVKGICIGTRTLSDGYITSEENYGTNYYTPSTHFNVYLVVTHSRRKPIYVPIEDYHVTEQKHLNRS